MKKLLMLVTGMLIGIASASGADYRASMDYAFPSANSEWQWSNFTKMKGLKWEDPQPKAFPQKNEDRTLTYSMDGNFKQVNKEFFTFINVFGDKAKPTDFYVSTQGAVSNEMKVYKQSLNLLFAPNALTEIYSNCSIPNDKTGEHPQQFFKVTKKGFAPLYIAHHANHYAGSYLFNTNVFPSFNDMVNYVNGKVDSGMKRNTNGKTLTACSFKTT